MKNLFVPYELALKLKEKGFDEPCLGYYGIWSTELRFPVYAGELENWNTIENLCSAPLYQQVQDWFREKHNLNITPQNCIQYPLDKELRKTGYGGNIYNHKTDTNLKSYFGETYYESLTKAIEEAIKLI